MANAMTLPAKLADYQPLVDSYQGQQDAANQANEKRYRSLLKTARRGGAMDRNLIRRNFEDERGAMQQGLMNRGLFNTTVLDSMNTRNRESRQIAMDQSRQNQRSEVMGIMERRTDQGPNSGLFANLLQGIGAGVGQQGGAAGDGAGRSYNFGGVNPSRFSTGGFGQEPQDPGAGGGGGSGPGGGVDFGQGGGGGGSAGGGTARGGPSKGFDASEFVYIPGFGRVRRGVNIYDLGKGSTGGSGGYGYAGPGR